MRFAVLFQDSSDLVTEDVHGRFIEMGHSLSSHVFRRFESGSDCGHPGGSTQLIIPALTGLIQASCEFCAVFSSSDFLVRGHHVSEVVEDGSKPVE